MEKIIYFATNGDSDSLGIYDSNKKLIYGCQSGDDPTYMIRALCKHVGFELKTANMPEVDGDYPQTLK